MLGKGKFICNYDGELCTFKELRKRKQSLHSRAGSYILEFKFNEKWWAIDATKEDGTLGRLINHSKRNKNIKPVVRNNNGYPDVYFVVLKDINKDEELVYDYGDNSKISQQNFPWLKM